MRRSNSTKALVPSTRTCGSSSEADCNLVRRAERCRGAILGERAGGERRTKARLLAQHWSSSPSARTASRLLHAIACCRSRFPVGQGRRFQPGRGLFVVSTRIADATAAARRGRTGRRGQQQRATFTKGLSSDVDHHPGMHRPAAWRREESSIARRGDEQLSDDVVVLPVKIALSSHGVG